jgi:hypothetical protein
LVVLSRRKISVAAIVAFTLIFPLAYTESGKGGLVHADDHGKIRMYRLNKKGQAINQLWVKKPKPEKCVNAIRNRKVFRFSQVGFSYCQIFSQKNCAQDSEVPAKWGGKKYRVADIDIEQPQIRLLRGTEWLLSPDTNMSIRSWYCSYQAAG